MELYLFYFSAFIFPSDAALLGSSLSSLAFEGFARETQMGEYICSVAPGAPVGHHLYVEFEPLTQSSARSEAAGAP